MLSFYVFTIKKESIHPSCGSEQVLKKFPFIPVPTICTSLVQIFAKLFYAFMVWQGVIARVVSPTLEKMNPLKS